MNYKSLMIIALALCLCLVLPVAAIWNNGNWIDEHANDGYNVIHDPVSGVDSKYKATPMFTEPQQNALLVGTIKVIVRSGYNTLTPEVGVRNDANPDGANGTFKFYPISPDGITEIEVIPGQFTLYIPNSNGGQDEFAHVTVAGGKITYVAMLGHAVSGSPAKVVSASTCPLILETKITKGFLLQWVWFRASKPDGLQDFTVKVSTNHGDVISTHHTYGNSYWHLGAAVPKWWKVDPPVIIGCKEHTNGCKDSD